MQWGLYKTSWIILFSFLISAYYIIVDNDPPSFPLPDNFDDAIDCFNFVNPTIDFEWSRIKVQYQVRDFIQYPTQVSSQLVYLTSKTQGTLITYNFSSYWDLLSNLYNVSFCVLQVVDGDVEAELHCHNKIIAKKNHYIQKVEIFPIGWSRMANSLNALVEINDACFSDSKTLHFLISQDAKFDDIILNQHEKMKIIPYNSDIDSYSEKNTCPKINYSAVFLAPYSTAPSYLIFDLLVPLMHYIDYEPATFDVLTTSKAVFKVLEPISYLNLKYLTKSCYQKITFLYTTGSHSPLDRKDNLSFSKAREDQLKFVLSASKNVYLHVYHAYKNYIKPVSEDPILITIDNSLSSIIPFIQESFPKCKVEKIDPLLNFTEIFSLVSKSKVLICSKFNSLLWGVALEAKSTLIELIPDNLNCISFTEQLRSKFMCSVNSVPSLSSTCQCISTDYQCYYDVKHEFKYLNKELLKSTIHAAIERTK